jgi:hypothetical protein
MPLKNCNDLPGLSAPAGITTCFYCNEGELLGKMQDPEYLNQSNGCGPFTTIAGIIPGWWVPDLGFTTACDFHDCCYGWCGALKPWCDHMFKLKMQAICDEAYGGSTLLAEDWAICWAEAQAFHSAVANHPKGQEAFDNAQDKACKICCCP